MGDPVQAPPSFSNFRFNSIGNISLLARLSDVSAQTQPLQTDEEEGDEDDLYINMVVDTPEPPSKQPVLLARIGDRLPTLEGAGSREVDSHSPLVTVFPPLPPGKGLVPNETSGGQPVTNEQSEAKNAFYTTSYNAAEERTTPAPLQGAPLLSISPVLANAPKQQSATDHPGQLQASTDCLPTPPPTSSCLPQDVGTPIYTLHQSSTPPLCTYPSLEQLLLEERTVWSEAAEMKHSRTGSGIINLPTASHEPASEKRSQSAHVDVHPMISTLTLPKQDNRNHMHSEIMSISTNSTSSPSVLIPLGNQHGQLSLLSKPAEGDDRLGHHMHSSSSPSQAFGFAEVVDDSPQVSSATVGTALPDAEGMLQTRRKSDGYAINEIALNTPQPSSQTPVQSVVAPENCSPREEQLKSLLKARRSGHSVDPAEIPERSASQLRDGSEPHTLQSPSISIPLRSEQCLDLSMTLAKFHFPQTDGPQRASRGDNGSSAPHAQLISNDASERSISHIVRSSAIKRKASQPPPPLTGVNSNQVTNQVTKRQRTTDRAPQDNTLMTTRAVSNTTSDFNLPSCKLSDATSLPPNPILVPCNSTVATALPSSDTTNHAHVISIPQKQAAREKSTPSPSMCSNEMKTPGNSIPPIKTEGNTNRSSGLGPKPLIKVKKEEPEEIMIRVKVEEDMKALEADLQKPLPIHANTVPLKKEESSDGIPFQPRNPSSSGFQERSQSVPATHIQQQQQQSVEQNDQMNRPREDTLVSKMVPRDHQITALHSQSTAPVQQNGPPELVATQEQVHLPRLIPSEVSGTHTLLRGQRGFVESCGVNSEPGLISPAPSSGALVSTSRSHSREELLRQPRNSDRQIRPSGTTGETTGRLAGRSTRQRERSIELNPRLLDHWSPPRDRAPLRTRPIADTYRPPPSPPEHAGRIPRRTMNVQRRDLDEDNTAQRRGDTWLASDGHTPQLSRRSRSASPRRSNRNRMRHSPSPPPRRVNSSNIGSLTSHQDQRAAMRTPSPHLLSLGDERSGLLRSFDTQPTTNHLPGPSWTLVDNYPSSIATHDEQPAPLHHSTEDVANTRCGEREPALDTGGGTTSYVGRDLIPNDSNLRPVDHGQPSSDERTQSHDYRLVPVPALRPTDETTDLLHDRQHVSQGAATVHNERRTTAPLEPNLDIGRTIIAAKENNASVPPHESLRSLSSTNLASSQLPWPSHASEQYCGTLRGLTTGTLIGPIANHREEERVLGAKISSCRRKNVVNDVQTALDQKDTEQSGTEGRMKENQTLENAQQMHGAKSPMRPNTDSMRKTSGMSDPPSVVSGNSPNSLPLLPSPKRPNTSRPPQRGQPHPQPGEDSSQPSNKNMVETSSQSLAQRISDEPTKPAPVHYDSDSAISLNSSPPHSPIPTLSSRLGDPLIHDESSHLKNRIPAIASSDMSLSSRITEPKPKAHQVRNALPPKPVPHREPINADSKAGSKLNNGPPKPSHASSAPQLLKRFNVSESEREPERPLKSRRGGRGAASVGRGRGRVNVGDHYSPRSPPRKPPARSKRSLEDRLS